MLNVKSGLEFLLGSLSFQDGQRYVEVETGVLNVCVTFFRKVSDPSTLR